MRASPVGLATTTSPVAVVAALVAEARSAGSVRARPGQDPAAVGGTLVCLSGIGPVRARIAALEAVHARGAVALVSWGTAAALRPGLGAGVLLLPRHVLGRDGTRFTVAPTWHARLLARLQDLPADADALLTHSDEVVADRDAKARLAQATGAAAVDMETAAVAEVAHAAGVPFLVVRAVADEAGHVLPPFLGRVIDPYGRARALRLALALARHPGSLPGLARVGGAFRLALRSLEAVRRRGGADLAWSDGA